MKYFSICLIACLGFIFSCNKKSDPAPTQTFVNGWNENLTINMGSQARYFRVYQPASLAAKAPVVILLHGGTQACARFSMLVQADHKSGRRWLMTKSFC